MICICILFLYGNTLLLCYLHYLRTISSCDRMFFRGFRVLHVEYIFMLFSRNVVSFA